MCVLVIVELNNLTNNLEVPSKLETNLKMKVLSWPSEWKNPSCLTC